MNNNQTIEDKRQILINFLNIYLSKKELKMKGLIRNVKGLLEKDQPITIKQFLAFVKFIEREKPFKGKDREQIVRYFTPLIRFPTEEFVDEYTN